MSINTLPLKPYILEAILDILATSDAYEAFMDEFSDIEEEEIQEVRDKYARLRESTKQIAINDFNDIFSEVTALSNDEIVSKLFGTIRTIMDIEKSESEQECDEDEDEKEISGYWENLIGSSNAYPNKACGCDGKSRKLYDNYPPSGFCLY